MIEQCASTFGRRAVVRVVVFDNGERAPLRGMKACGRQMIDYRWRVGNEYWNQPIRVLFSLRSGYASAIESGNQP